MRISDWSSDVCSSDLATTETGTYWGLSSVRRAVTTMSSKPEFKGACLTSTVDGSRLAAAAAFCAAACDGKAITAIAAIDTTDSLGFMTPLSLTCFFEHAILPTLPGR